MRLLIDCDGVCNHFLRYLLQEINAPVHYDEIRTHQLSGFLDRHKVQQAYDLMESPGFWAQIPPMEEAQEACEELRADGHDLVWVTKPWESCIGWETVRRGWLYRHFRTPPDNVAPLGRKELIGGHCLIEDKAQNLEAWKVEHMHGLAFLYPQPYNEGVDLFERLDWPAIVRRVKEYRG